MSRSTLGVADIFRRQGQQYFAQHPAPPHQRRLIGALEKCRTADLGGHVERCSDCNHQRVSYNSCRNRHCPQCQYLARRKWIEKRKAELLPIPYYHVVFTIPEQLNPLALQNKELIYKTLFNTSAATLLEIAADPKHLGATIGFFSILHTWGQQLNHHPHIHCVATGGGLTPEGAWKPCKPNYFLCVKVLSSRFKTLFLEALQRAFQKQSLNFHGALTALAEEPAFLKLLDSLQKIDWVVYAKPPFGGPQQVIEYLGLYTHRVAISNDRLLSFDGNRVTFQYKNYRAQGRLKARQMTLTANEFMRRFLFHALPTGFQRIRHYGLLSGKRKKTALPLCRCLLVNDLLPATNQIKEAFEPAVVQPTILQSIMEAALRCPVCRSGYMLRVETLAPKAWDSS